ncbi:hypothetical protein [Leptospira ilyithenensis]|uniref:Uncharacterized protein n=1 Tax=Leptospira ilyithenensis TaxID=2484901 RepID=A0A4R9LQB8_9LEPT|nr:hypothetical protein [Leptospira ilyithenensis]TGN10030.1 hypothetical protein EHS11_10730 [Leptospira ilyithenensis]
MATSTDDLTFESYLKERRFEKKISKIRQYIYFGYLGLFLYLLFSSKYTASPLIVLINYLAMYTSFSGIIHFKFFEIPKILTELIRPEKTEVFDSLSPDKRAIILENTFHDMGIYPIPENLSEMNVPEIITRMKLEDRYPWKRIGWIYLFKYIAILGLGSIYLVYTYFQTGFLLN